MGNTDSRLNNTNAGPSVQFTLDSDSVEINDKSLVDFPIGLAQLKLLKVISLSRNKISKIDGISGVVLLEDLDLSQNCLQSLPGQLPREIGLVSNLTILNLSFNQLTALPVEIGKLGNLTKLILNNNKIQSLPSDIGKLVQLVQLDLAENELRTLPTQIGGLKALTKLYLDNNDFLEMISEVGNLENLKELNLRSNQLVDLPSSMHKLTRLTILDLDDNQWESNEYTINDIPRLLDHLKTKKDVVNKSRKSTSKEYRRTITRQKLEDKKRLTLNSVFDQQQLQQQQQFQIVEYQKKLIQIKGSYRIFSRRVALSPHSLNNGDVFILDCGKKIFVLNGSTSSQRERLKGIHVARILGEETGTSDIITIDSNSKRDDINEFWREMGGKVAIKNSSDDDGDIEEDIIMSTKLFKFFEKEKGRLDIQAFAGEILYKTMLDSACCAILDTGTDIYVWSGLYCSANERNWSMLKAEELIGHGKRPEFSEILWVVDGMETILFKENFIDWDDYEWDPDYAETKAHINQREEMQRAEAERERLRMEKEEEEEMIRQNNRRSTELKTASTTTTTTTTTIKPVVVVPSPTLSTILPATTTPTSTPTTPVLSERDRIKEREKEKIREKLKQRESSAGKLPGVSTPTSVAPSLPQQHVLPSIPKQSISTPPIVPKTISPPTTPPQQRVELPPISKPTTTTPIVLPPVVSTPSTTTTKPLPQQPTVSPISLPKVSPTTTTPTTSTTTTPKSTTTTTTPTSTTPTVTTPKSTTTTTPTSTTPVRKPATKNPIRARQERALQEEESAKKRLEESANNPTTAATAPVAEKKINAASHAIGGMGLLYSLGADEHFFKKRAETKAQAVTESPFSLNIQPKDQPKLLHVKGRRSPFVRQVELSYQSLNKGDVFILDCGKERNLIYQWNGSEANRIEKGKGMDIAKSIKDKERVGCRVIIVDEGKETDDFWTVLGSRGTIASADSAGDDREAELSIRQHISLYRTAGINNDTELDLIKMDGRLSKAMLEPSECYILDCVSEMFVWTGSASKLKIRNMSLKMAAEMFSQRTFWTAPAVHREFPGSEQVLFKERFPDWGGSLPIMVQQAPVGVNTASSKKQEKIDVGSMLRPKAEKEEVMIDDGSGKVTIWRIEEFQKVPLDPSTYGQFYSGDSYLILYTYFFKNKDNYLIYFWQGRNSSINEKGTSALLTIELDDQLQGMAKEVRVVQNKEPKHFLTIFKGKFIVHSGKDPLSKNYKAPSSTKDPLLYHVRGTTDFNTRVIQCKLSPHTLNSYNSYILNNTHNNSTIYIWYGKHSNTLERQLAKSIFTTINYNNSSKSKFVEIEEGKESSEFFKTLGGKEVYPLAQTKKRIEPRLYHCTIGSGVFTVDEVTSFAQDDLIQEDVFIVDGVEKIWVWVGSDTTEIERRSSMEVAVEYSAALDGDRKNIPVYITYSGKEPYIFTCLFHGWDYSKRKQPAGEVTYDKDIVLAKEILDQYTKKYSYDDLVNKRYPKGLDGSRLEEYLSEEEFYRYFACTLSEFQKLSLWKKQSLKKELRLY
eukprot:gene1564-1983_t